MSDFKNTLNLARPFYRGLPIIAATMVVSILVAKKYLKYTTPMYESATQIKLADAQIGIPHSNLYRDFDLFASSNKIGAEVEMLKSEVVISRALRKIPHGITAYRIGELHKTMLYNDCPFTIIPYRMNPDGYDSTFKMTITQDSILEITTPSKEKFSSKINRLVQTPRAEFYVVRNDSLLKRKPFILLSDKFEFTINSEKKSIEDIQSNIDVFAADKEVPILRIAYKTPVAQKSADIVNAVSVAYIEDYIDEKLVAADTTVAFLDKEVGKGAKRLTASEGAIQGFKESNNVVNIKQETETNLKKISELENHLSELQMDLVSIDSLDNYVKRGRDHFPDLAPNFQTFNDLLSTEMIKKIKSLQSDRHDLLLKYTPENDKVKVIDSKLNDVFTYMQESISNTRQNLQVKYDDLSKTVREEKASFASYPYKDRNMTVLERDFNLNDQIYRFLSEKKTDAEIAKAANISFHRIISMGEVPKLPVSPNPALIKALAGFLGFLGSVLLIYIVHFVKGRINNETTIHKSSDTILFAKIPFLKTKAIAAKTFQKTAVDLQIKKYLENGAVIALNSFNNKEGKRTITTGLSKAITDLGKKVLVIDADGKINQEHYPLADHVELSTLQQPWQQPELLKQLFANWKKQYQVILIKNLAAATEPAALLLMAEASLNLMILDSRVTKMKYIEETDLLKIELGLDNTMFVLNRDGYTPSLLLEMKRRLKNISFKPSFIKRAK